MTTTPRMGISHLTASQAQKHVTVNAAFDRIDALWNLLIESNALTAPPGGESEGQAWIVAATATGDWEGHEDEIALYINGGYEFQAPFEGLGAWIKSVPNQFTYSSGSWTANPGNTSLSFARDATTVTVESDTGADAVLPAATPSLAGVLSAADKTLLDGLVAAYLPPVQDVTALTALAEADLTDKIRIFVEDENAILHYDATAVAGDYAPDDQTGGTGFWIAIAAGGGGAVAVDDEGSEVLATASRLNFEGAGVTVTDGGGGEAVVTIPGGGGGVSDGDKGDITVSGSGATWSIDAAAVTLAKMADVATARILGRTTSGTGVPEALTAVQATALLDAFTTSLKGLVPASGGGTTNFLRADGSWAAPAGGGGGGTPTFLHLEQQIASITALGFTAGAWRTRELNTVIKSGISGGGLIRELAYDAQSANFIVGSTVTGGTSGATGLIVADVDAGSTGTLRVVGVVGTFADNEALTGSGGGAATANIPAGVVVPGTFWLPAGDYYIEAFAWSYKVNQNVLRLYNVTDATSMKEGLTCYAITSTNDFPYATLRHSFTLAAAKEIRLEHRCETTNGASGMAAGGASWQAANNIASMLAQKF